MAAPLRLLLVEHDEQTAARLLALLTADGFIPVCERTCDEATLRRNLGSGACDAVICSDPGPGHDLRGILRLVRAQGGDIPVVVVGEGLGEAQAVRLHHDGVDHLVPTASLSHLAQVLRRALADVASRRQGRRTEDALRVAADRQRAIVDAAPVAMLVVDREQRVRAWNPAAESLFGWRSDELEGLFLPVVPRHALREFLLACEEVLAGRTLPGIEVRWQHRTGRPVELRLSAAPLRDAGGRVEQVLFTAADVTERNDLERRLQQAQRMEAIGRLAGGVAHDFNNLLQVISARSQLLRERLAPGDPLRQDADLLIRTSERGARLTRQLLAYSRRQVLTPRVVDLNQVVGDLGRILPGLVGEDIALSLASTAAPLLAEVDPAQLEQVVLNLALNARDAMPTGGRLGIALADVSLDGDEALVLPDLNPGRWCRITVTDNGHGIDPAVLPRIFEPFFTTRDNHAGLGLATAYGIVRQSGGTIAVESSPGAGATFSVWLPRSSAQVAGQQPGSGPVPVLPAVGTVLVVEDDADVRALVEEILSGAGMRVLAAAGLTEALALAQRAHGRVDVLLTDVIMPEAGGREVAERVGSLCPDAAVLFMSGYAGENLRRSGVDSDDLLAKPFTPRELLKAIEARLPARTSP